MSDTRIVLVKPGDVLMLGNVTLPPDEEALGVFHEALRTLKNMLGLEHILVFEDDIDLAVKPGGSQQSGWYVRGGIIPRSPDGTAEHIRYGVDYVRDRYAGGGDH